MVFIDQIVNKAREVKRVCAFIRCEFFYNIQETHFKNLKQKSNMYLIYIVKTLFNLWLVKRVMGDLYYWYYVYSMIKTFSSKFYCTLDFVYVWIIVIFTDGLNLLPERKEFNI
jgi:hypothetical protein